MPLRFLTFIVAMSHVLMAAEPVSKTSGKFAKAYYVTTAADGRGYVVVHKPDGKSLPVRRTQSSLHKIRVISLNWSDEPGKSTATLKKGDDLGSCKFVERAQPSSPRKPEK